MVQLLEAMRSDIYGNCRFTPTDLTRWSLFLFRYDLSQEAFSISKSPDGLLRAWSYEACRVFQDRLMSYDSKIKFISMLSSILRKDWGSDISIINGHEIRELDAVVFQEVLDNMAKVDRRLQPGGSLLAVGKNGSGCHLAVTVIAHSHDIPIVTPRVHLNYTAKNLSNDLKTAMHMSGIEGKDSLLLLEDYQLLSGEFLEMIDSLLSSGEVPELYTPPELEPLLNPLKDLASQEGFRGSITSFYAQCVKRNLHIAVLMDFSDPQFLFRCKSNPALYKSCNVLWLDDWSDDSMTLVPKLLLSEKDEEDQGLNSEQEFYESFSRIHKHCSKKNQSPRKFIAFIQNYKNIFAKKCSEIDSEKKHLQDSGDQKIELEKLKARIEEENIKLSKCKKDIDLELNEIEPIVQEAKSAVGNIKSEALSEIRSLRPPPDVIRDILEGVLRLMGIFDTSWVSMKSFLSKRGVKEDILAFDARNISPEIRESVEKLPKKNSESFDSKKIPDEFD